MNKLCRRLSSALLPVAVTLAGVSWATAGDGVQANKEIRRDKQEIADAKQALDQFRASIDQWHVANLEGDAEKIERHQSEHFGIIETDIKQSQTLVLKCENEAGRSAGDLQGTNSREQSQDLRVDLANLKAVRQVLMAKEKLFFALKRSKSFSNMYRLLNDYAELLQRELGVVQMELAEDVQGIRLDK